MSKPKTRDEAFLKKRFKHEDDVPYEIQREARQNKRIWKKKTTKLQRRLGKQDLDKRINDEDQ